MAATLGQQPAESLDDDSAGRVPGPRAPRLKRRSVIAAVVIAAVYILLNVSLYTNLGIRQGADTRRYVSGAVQLRSGEPLDGKQASYLAYVTLVAAGDAAGLGWPGLVALQCLAGLAAIAAVFASAAALGGRRAGWIAAVLLAVNVDLWRFNFYILTDSPYASSLAVLTALSIAFMRRKKAYALIGALAAGVVTVLLRPTGWILVPFFAAFAPGRWRPRSAVPVVAGLALLLAALAVFSPALYRRIGQERPERHLRDGTVVWGSRWKLPMPEDPPQGSGAWSGSASYVLRHPVACARLALTRVSAELLHVRGTYSTRHNAAVLLWYMPLYVLAAAGFARNWRDPEAQLTGGVIASHLLVVALLFADWDGRFLLHVVPLITALAGVGGSALMRDQFQRSQGKELEEETRGRAPRVGSRRFPPLISDSGSR